MEEGAKERGSDRNWSILNEVAIGKFGKEGIAWNYKISRTGLNWE